MATYNQTVINARLQVVADAIDAGAGGGLVNIWTTGMAVLLSQIVLNKPCATIAAGILTFAGLPLVDISANAGGTAAVATITDSAGTVVISGLTVGTIGTDIIISTTSITAGDVVTFISGTITGN